MQVMLTIFGMLGIVGAFTYAVVYPFHFRTATPPDIHNIPTLAAALAFTLFGTGLNQELHFRGFVQSRLAKAFGEGTSALHAAIVVTAVLFGLLHLGLGPANAVMAGLAGVVLGEMYLSADRNLWVVVVAHSLGNAALLIWWYLNP